MSQEKDGVGRATGGWGVGSVGCLIGRVEPTRFERGLYGGKVVTHTLWLLRSLDRDLFLLPV